MKNKLTKANYEKILREKAESIRAGLLNDAALFRRLPGDFEQAKEFTRNESVMQAFLTIQDVRDWLEAFQALQEMEGDFG